MSSKSSNQGPPLLTTRPSVGVYYSAHFDLGVAGVGISWCYIYVTSRSSSASQTDRALNELARCTPAARGELESWLGLNVSRRPSFLCTPNVILAQLSTRRKEIVDIYALVFIHTYLVSVVMNEWE